MGRRGGGDEAEKSASPSLSDALGLPFSGGDGSRFTVLRRLGQGGMGVVYEVFDNEQKRHLALKTLHPEGYDGAALLRFKREFRLLQDIQHENLVELGELMEEGGRFYFTMELVRGKSFLDYVCGAEPADGTISASADASDTFRTLTLIDAATLGAYERSRSFVGSVAEARTPDPRPAADEEKLRDALVQVARGLITLHAANRVHRDIKPSNVLVSETGRVKILDFGLVAYALRDDDERGRVVGTPMYMSPEQARGARAGPASDWYSVGVLLYCALTGRPPLSGEDVLLHKQVQDAIPPRLLAPDVPPDLDQLCVRLLHRDPAQRANGYDVLACMRTASSVSPPGDETFVGRRAELEALAAAYERARESQTTFFVHGESGVGKSALVERFAEQLRTGREPALVLRSRCYERESVPYKAFDGIVDSLSDALLEMSAEEVATILPDDAALLATVFPVLRRVVDDEMPSYSERGVPERRRAAVFGALRTLLRALARRQRVVLVIDDIQWTDEDSIALLREVLRPPEAPPLLVLATARSGSDAKDAFSSSSWPGAVEYMKLEGLPDDEARELARRLLDASDDPSSVDVPGIASETHGHPFFIAELVRHEKSGHSRGLLRLDDAVAARVGRLEAGAREVLELVAISSVPLSLEVATEAAGIEFTELARCLHELRGAKLVRTSGARARDRIEPYHDRLRRAALSLMDSASTSTRHRALARCLERRTPRDAEALAVHWGGAGEVAKQRHFTLMAAKQAEEALAFHRAAEHYRMALTLADNDSEASALREKLGDALALAGSGFEAGEAYALAAKTAVPERSRALRRRAAMQYLSTGHLTEGVALFEEVLGELKLALPKTAPASLVSLLTSRLRLRLQGLSFREREAVAVRSDVIERIEACLAATLGFAFVDPIRAADFQARTLALSLRAGEPTFICRALAPEMTFAVVQGDYARAKRTADLAVSIAERLGRPPHVWALVCAGLGSMAFVEGRWRLALARFTEVDAALREHLKRVDRNEETAGGALPIELRRWQYDNCNIMIMGAYSWMGEVREFYARYPSLLAEALERKNSSVATNLRSGIHVIQWLARDDVELAEERTAHAFHGWEKQKRASSIHYLDYFARAQIALYRVRAAEAYKIARAGFFALWRALTLRASYYRVSMLDLRGRCAVAAAAAATSASVRATLLRAAERDAARIAKETMASCPALAAIISASAAGVRGDTPRAARLFEEAIVASDRADMQLHREAARRRLGEMLGGDEGRALVRRADEWMASETVAAPAALTRVFAPS